MTEVCHEVGMGEFKRETDSNNRNYTCTASQYESVCAERDQLRLALQEAQRRVKELQDNRDQIASQLNEYVAENDQQQAVIQELAEALRLLRGDANRLCDRNLGGTYEDDCRRAIAKADTGLAKAAPWIPNEEITHGKNCPKVEHVAAGYLHGADEDGPYEVDGVMYCGRCHSWLRKEEK